MQGRDRTDIVAGQHDVVSFIDRQAMRVEHVLRVVARAGERPDQSHLRIVFHHRAGRSAGGTTHECYEKPAVLQWSKLIGDGSGRWIARAREARMART